VLSTPGSEDNTVHEVIWTPWEGQGIEHLRVTERQEGIDADGLIVGLHEIGAFRLRYRIVCDAGWRVRQVHLALMDGGRSLELGADGDGHWVDENGLSIAGLDGCIDIDISGSPFTNTLPIRRLGLQVGQSADLPMVYIHVPTLRVEQTMQRYTCLESGTEGSLYRFEGLDSGYTAVLPVDGNGLVLDYPELFRRAWSSEYRTVREGDRIT